MTLYVLIDVSSSSRPTSARACFFDSEWAHAIAEDPWEAACVDSDGEFVVVAAELIGPYKKGDAVYAAYRGQSSKNGPDRFLGLYSDWDAAEEAAGKGGASHPLNPDDVHHL